jgi:two-component system chemotaxis response regulator CheY
MRVLVVDDSAFLRKLVVNALVANGYQIAGEAPDGAATVALYPQLKPDLVTLDLVMPKMDGLAALRALRALDPRARIVMVSAASELAAMQRALQEGALGYVVKPFKEAEVVAAVRAASAATV